MPPQNSHKEALDPVVQSEKESEGKSGAKCEADKDEVERDVVPPVAGEAFDFVGVYHIFLVTLVIPIYYHRYIIVLS